MTRTLPYGSWPSPITAAAVSAQGLNPREIVVDGQQLYWLESRPAQQGRTTIMRLTASGKPESLLDPPFDCRSRVHEYGGGSYTVCDGTVYFSHGGDNQIYSLAIDGNKPPKQISHNSDCRYAALCMDSPRQRLIAVCEQHTEGSSPLNSIVSLSLESTQPAQILPVRILLSGEDFYAGPLLSPCGQQLCWLSWSHPAMPWQASQLWLAEFDSDGLPGKPRLIAGGATESICQPKWSPDGTLHFISDRSGWWNLYRWQKDEAQALCQQPADFAVPQWVFGQSNYSFINAHTLLCSYCEKGHWQLLVLNSMTGEHRTLANDFVQLTHMHSSGQQAYFIGATRYHAASVVTLNTDSWQFHSITQTPNISSKESISIAAAIEFTSEDEQPCHGLYYPPLNPHYTAPDTELPPLIVIAHGGPTGVASPAYEPAIQFWTSRGFAVLAVNYRGSALYGRQYRLALDGRWGLADAEDCVAAARYLVAQGLVDPDRLIIRGSSAGGLTVLSALAFHSLFATGASYYGISDLELLAQQTHKFESHYMESLIGPYPEQRQRYQHRSAIHNLDKLNQPIIFFQGLKDQVVPPNQTRAMVAALRHKQVPVAEILFEQEGHGFRQAENIATALTAELHFYAQLFGFEVSDPIAPQLAAALPD